MSVDPLTQLVELLRPRTLLWKHMVWRGDWGLRMPADQGVVFGQVVSGSCRYQLPDTKEATLDAGDYLLLTKPSPWMLRGGSGRGEVVDFDPARHEATATSAETEDPLPDEVRIVGGHFEFDPTSAELLTSFMAPVVHLRTHASGEEDDRLARVLAMIDAEASGTQPGRDAVLSRLIEIVLIEVLRAPALLSDHRRGMLTGLSNPPVATSLRAFHADVARNWSVASLAAEATMSRSAYSQRFTSLVGQPPMTYALQWRMAVARDALRSGGRSLDDVASATGYASVSAFTTAFTRTVGVPPARYARGELTSNGGGRRGSTPVSHRGDKAQDGESMATSPLP